MKLPPVALRFLSKVTVDLTGCWRWIATFDKRSCYGTFSIKSVWSYSHRVAWQLFRGNIPAGMLICHTCDNRWCVNPDHLFVGTSHDNIVDAYKKGRMVQPRRLVGQCRHGHLITDANIGVKANGARYCRECRRRSFKVWEQKNRDKRNEYMRKWRRERAGHAA